MSFAEASTEQDLFSELLLKNVHN